MSEEPPYREVGERISKAMEAKGFTNQKLQDAMRLNDPERRRVSISSISDWRNGKQLPQKYAELLERTLGVDWRVLRWGPAGKPELHAIALTEDALAAAMEMLQQRGWQPPPERKAKEPPPKTSGMRALLGQGKQHR